MLSTQLSIYGRIYFKDMKLLLAIYRSNHVKRLFIICLCVIVIIGIWLLSAIDNVYNRGGLNRTNGDYWDARYQVQLHRKNVWPFFIRKAIHNKTATKHTLVIHQSTNTTSFQHLYFNLTKITAAWNRSFIYNALKENQSIDLKDQHVLESLIQDVENITQCYDVHIFYYPWYGNEKYDHGYYHWNHAYIPHWNKKEALKWPSGIHKPPADIGSNYYPFLGCYSSRDPDVVDMHMLMLRYAGIGVAVVSWYPPGDADNEGKDPDSLMPMILSSAFKFNIKVAVHVEPYKNRDQDNMKKNLEYLLRQYGSHPAYYRTLLNGKDNLPLVYIYDSYLVESKKWADIFNVNGSKSIRGTELDGIFIGLLVDYNHRSHILESGFDGFYTYFATNGFTYGSTWKNWLELSNFAKSFKLLFIPSVGPGYIDTEVRPWNAHNTRDRQAGSYYVESFSSALQANPNVISITSFNEWHEGTQIEAAVHKLLPSRKYLNYGDKGPLFYLNLTRHWVSKFISRKHCLKC